MLKNLLIFLSITCVYFAALIILNNFGVSDFFNVVICSFILGITLRTAIPHYLIYLLMMMTIGSIYFVLNNFALLNIMCLSLFLGISSCSILLQFWPNLFKAPSTLLKLKLN